MRIQPSRLAVSLGLSLGIVLNGAAATHFVDLKCTNPVPPYSTWATAATNIQDAVMTASFLDTVLVTNGIYQYAGISGSGPNRVEINAPILLQSVNGPAVTVIKGYQVPGTTNGPSAVRCVYLGNGGTLSGFTLTNGATANPGFGGGVYCESTNCLVTNCVITGNAANNGGGGAFSGTLVNCSVIGNSTSPLSFGNGGGAYQSTLVNCLLTRNFAGYSGGAATYCSLINCTVVSNSIAAYKSSLEGGTVKNSIVYYNFIAYTNADTGSGAIFSNCCVSFTPPFGANNFTNPPLFANLSAGDFHLSPASPCINAGDNSFVASSTDLDGNPRLVRGIVDVGAYEYQNDTTVHYVSLTSANPVTPYTNWNTAATNIQDAIDVAGAGDFIIVNDGIYNVGGRAVYGLTTNRVSVDKAVTVQSVNGAGSTMIAGRLFLNGGVAIRCAYLSSGAVLSGFTLTNGSTPPVSGDLVREGSGGGIWCEDNSAVVSNCVLTGNYVTGYGGGAFQGTLFNCMLTNNSAGRGGGAASNTLFNCTLTHNSSLYRQSVNYGGGAYACTLSNCLLVGNQSMPDGYGGGAAFSALTGCVASNNAAAFGGGVYFGIANNSLISSNRASIAGGAFSNILNNCVLSRNLAIGDGGGAASCTLANCTVVSNTSLSGASGGILAGSATNCILYFNSASQGGPNYFQSNLRSCDAVPLASGLGNITNDPILLNLAGGDFHLQTNSPCINAGNNSSVASSTDLDGNPRIAGGTVDIGAYEYQNPVSGISYAWLLQFGLPIAANTDVADPDGDAMNNYQEWIAGTDPNSASSVLKLLTPDVSVSAVNVSWQSVSNRTYLLERSSNLAAQPAFSVLQSNIVGQAGTTSFQDLTATNGGPYFYRVGVH